MISNRVMKMDEFKEAIFYKADCSCGEDDHITTIEMEYDSQINDISINFYKTIAWCSHWNNYNWFERVWKQLKASIKLLFTGYIELEEIFTLEGGEHLNTFIEALHEGRDKVEAIRNAMRKK